MQQLFEINFLHLSIAGFLFCLSILITRANLKWEKLLPSSIIIGVIGFVLVNTILQNSNFRMFSNIAFHAFNLSVISIGLTKIKKSSHVEKNYTHKGVFWMTFVFTSVLCLQALVGYMGMEIYNSFSDNAVYSGFGFLTAHGFAQGSGYILSIGKVWENQYNIQGAISIGLAFSSIGYLMSVVIGLPFTNIFLAKNRISQKTLSLDEKTKDIILPERLSLVSHVKYLVKVVLIYLLSIFIAYLIRLAVYESFLNQYPLVETIANLIPSLLFVIGLLIALLFKRISSTFNNDQTLSSEAIQKANTSRLVDLMVISMFISIQFIIISKFIAPILFLSALVIFFTCSFFLILKRFSKFNLLNERIAALIGTSFGSLANGLILLRILDREMKTSVHLELALMNFYSGLTLGPVMIVIFLIGRFENMNHVAFYYALTLIVSLGMLYMVEKKNG